MTLEYPLWKKAIIFVVLAFGLLYSLPNIYPQDPAVQISASRNAVLDEATKEKVQGDLERAKIAFKSIELSDKRLLVRLVDGETQLRVSEMLRASLGENYSVALNLASTVPNWLSAVGANPMTLGLDLQGGVHFLMEVDSKAVIEAGDERLIDDIKTMLRDKNIRGTAVRAADGVLVTLRNDDDRRKAAGEIAGLAAGVQLLDVPGAADSFPLSVKVPQETRIAAMDQVIEQNLSTLRNRINALGVAEPVIQRQGASRIAVQLPGVQDTAAAKKILGATATLEYRLSDVENAGRIQDVLQTGRSPAGSKLYFTREGQPVLLSRRVIAQGDEIVTATSTIDPDSGTPAVSIRLNDAGGQKMLRVTEENVGRPLAVVFIERIPETKIIDGKEVRTARMKEEVISIANIREPFGKHFQTTGLEKGEADELALLLRAGSLSAPIDIVEERIIGPSLGADNIKSGVRAVLYSFGFVMAFFVIYYKMFGVVTNLSVLLNLLLVVAVMSLFGATLTLPGLAGIALTVGMSVDANVLINERIREELRGGTSPLASIAIGYEKASGTILDANITALLGGVALFSFGSGPIRGFALSLCVGILTSMYTAVSVSRGIASLFYSGRKKLARLSI
ncbi:MAG TPA: protein translocase subunit SecD [Pseudomonadota bacterium]|nr:protein translocase subunit SecD [Xanthomonadales bacterium]HQW81342.1 protein translocase subunit SecD [Pseudomonadota bacterium]